MDDIDSIKVIECFFSVPLDYSNPEAGEIRVFARNMVPLGKNNGSDKEKELPYRTPILLFFMSS